VQQRIIQAIELATAKMSLLRKIRRFEAMGVPHGQPFWAQALGVMGIDILTPEAEIARIPRDGPLVVTANHPHGLVDGMVLAELIGRVRTDYKILTRSLLTGVAEIDQFMLPVPFAHDPDALTKNVEMRRLAMRHLAEGGVIALFPAGVVASAERFFGPAIERDWNAFTAKMIQRSGATVLPIRFPGRTAAPTRSPASSRPRSGRACCSTRSSTPSNRPQRPHIGMPMSPEEIAGWAGRSRWASCAGCVQGPWGGAGLRPRARWRAIAPIRRLTASGAPR
jgi:putative hemolysin